MEPGVLQARAEGKGPLAAYDFFEGLQKEAANTLVLGS
jgi:hypothetical protein